MNMKRNWFGWVLIGVIVVMSLTIIGMLLIGTSRAVERADRLQAQLEELTTQNRGPQGPEGDQGPPGRAPTAQEIAAAVEAYCDAHNECQGPSGANGTNGRNGTNGSTGARGATGAAGAGVTRVVCDGTSIAFYAGSTLVGRVSMVCLR